MTQYMSAEEFYENFQKFKTTAFSNCSRQEAEAQLCTYLTILQTRLPLFYPGHCTQKLQDLSRASRPKWYQPTLSNMSFFFNGKYYCGYHELKDQPLIYISPVQAIGETWLYENERNTPSNPDRPKPDRLARILMGEPEELPEINAYRAGEYFVCTDGNHRIYAAYLLKREVKIQCAGVMKSILDGD